MVPSVVRKNGAEPMYPSFPLSGCQISWGSWTREKFQALAILQHSRFFSYRS